MPSVSFKIGGKLFELTPEQVWQLNIFSLFIMIQPLLQTFSYLIMYCLIILKSGQLLDGMLIVYIDLLGEIELSFTHPIEMYVNLTLGNILFSTCMYMISGISNYSGFIYSFNDSMHAYLGVTVCMYGFVLNVLWLVN